jgi:hypothetical protein
LATIDAAWTAMKVASQLVMFLKRPDGQMPFNREGEAVQADRRRGNR